MRKIFKNIILIIALVGLAEIYFYNFEFFQLLEMKKEKPCMRKIRDVPLTNIDLIIDKLNSYKKEYPGLRDRIETILSLLKSDDIFVRVQGLRTITYLPENIRSKLIGKAIQELRPYILDPSESISENRDYVEIIDTAGELLRDVNDSEFEIEDRLFSILKDQSPVLRKDYILNIVTIKALTNLYIRYHELKIDSNLKLNNFLNYLNENFYSPSYRDHPLILHLPLSSGLIPKIFRNSLFQKPEYKMAILKSVLRLEKNIGIDIPTKIKVVANQIINCPLKMMYREGQVQQIKLWANSVRFLIQTDNLDKAIAGKDVTKIIDEFVEVMNIIDQDIRKDRVKDVSLVETVTLEAAKLSKPLWIHSSEMLDNMARFDFLRDRIFSTMGESIQDGVNLFNNPFIGIWLNNILQDPGLVKEVNWSKDRVAKVLNKIFKFVQQGNISSIGVQLYSLLGQVGYKDKEMLEYLEGIFNSSSIPITRRRIAKAIADILLSEIEFD